MLAMNALVLRTPNVPEARRHLEILERKKVAADPAVSGAGEARRDDRRPGGAPGRAGAGSNDHTGARLGSG